MLGCLEQPSGCQSPMTNRSTQIIIIIIIVTDVDVDVAIVVVAISEER